MSHRGGTSLGVIQICVLIVAFALAMPSPSDSIGHDSIGHDAAWVRAQVAANDLTATERAWEQIHWVSRLDQALELSHRYRRPILVLTYFGAIDGRC